MVRIQKVCLLGNFATILMTVVGVSGCATGMSKEDCEKTDYYQIGLEDGKSGKRSTRLEELSEKCSRQGVAVPVTKYKYGRDVGMAEYCSADRGKSDARSGKLDSLCIQEKVPPYETGFRQELELLKRKKLEGIKSLQKTQDENKVQQDKLKNDLNQIDQQQIQVPAQTE